VVEAILHTIYQHARPAAPGEFTQRAFLNGRMDLTQAEAVAEIVSAANTTQLAAAERLLGGRFAEVIAQVRAAIIELLGNLEAGLDFSEEAIEFITADAATAQIAQLRRQLTALLDGSVRCERLIDLDAVGLAGAPNAGKSSLLNALLGRPRSLVSPAEATTRDVLTGVLSLARLDCVLFDCAGLLTGEPAALSPVDALSHQASLTALNRAAVVVFCVDLGKRDIRSDVALRDHIVGPRVLFAATQADAVAENDRPARLARLQEAFGEPFWVTSARDGTGVAAFKDRLEETLAALRAGDRDHEDRLTLNQRHEQRLRQAVKVLGESADEIEADSAEIAAMLLRQAYDLLGTLEHEHLSETVLASIFSRFCVGK
jgi:tRNA modification GTPase